MIQLGGQESVDAVLAMYDDTCCQNSIDPSDHFLPKLFPNCKRAPLKDVFHHVQGVLDQTKGFFHPLHETYAAGIWDIVLLWEKESEDAALNNFMSIMMTAKSSSLLSKHVKSYESTDIIKIQFTTTFQMNLASWRQLPRRLRSFTKGARENIWRKVRRYGTHAIIIITTATAPSGKNAQMGSTPADLPHKYIVLLLNLSIGEWLLNA
jgi:hypothetical protein